MSRRRNWRRRNQTGHNRGQGSDRHCSFGDRSFERASRDRRPALRLRKLVVQPGGVVPWHSHGDRHAIIYIIDGTITEYASNPMPSFMLPDDQGHLVSLEALLAKGPLALSFHRGHWCPYCRINTNALAQAQCDVEPIGGQIVAITPDLQHFTTALKADAAAKPFPILTDVDNGYALSLNLAIFVGLKMQKFMKGAGWDIAPYQGNDAWILPIPATFVVGRDSIIRPRYVDPDYRKRMAIDIIVDALRAC